MPCLSRVPRLATDSASLVLFLLTEDAALMVNSALGKVTLLVCLLPIVLSVQAFGVDADLRVDVFGVVPCFGVGVLGGSLICAVFSSVSFFIVSGVLEVLFHDFLLHGGNGIIFLSQLALDRCFPGVLGFGSAVSFVPDKLAGGHHPFDHLFIVHSYLCHDWPCVPLLQLVRRDPGARSFRNAFLDHGALPEHVV